MAIPERNGQTTSPSGPLPTPPPDPNAVSFDRDPAIRKSGFLQRAAVFMAILGLFAGALFATQYYVRHADVFPSIRNPFAAETGTASTDINLRIQPSTDNDPIGLVTKNSKLRIIDKKDSWYQVDIIEQGRPSNGPTDSSRGWVYGRFVELNNN